MEDVVPDLLIEPREVAFELDNVELVDGQLELTGRWFGVQGRRFMRPTLTVRGDACETRLLADLAHKPWAAENGEPWHAAFPCDGELDSGNDAELTVAPDLTVEVPVPDAARSRRGGRKRDKKPRQKAGTQPEADKDGRASAGAATARVGPQPTVQDRVQDERTRALSAARAEIATLRERIEELGAQLERERTGLAKEVGEAQEAKAEALRNRDEAVAARDEALRGRDQAIAARRKALESREMAQQTIEQALAARGKAKRAAEQALSQRDEALARLDRALAERDEAMAQHDRAAGDLKRAVEERDELTRANEQLRGQYGSTVAPRGAALMTRTAGAPSSTDRRHSHRLAVAIAFTSLLVVTLAVILILSSH